MMLTRVVAAITKHPPLIPPEVMRFLHHHGVVALFVLVLLQDVGVPTLVPGTVLVLFGGYLVYTGAVGFHVAALTLAAGAFIGATGMFFLARFGGRPVVLRLGRYVGLNERSLDAAARGLERFGPPMLLLTRVAPGTRVYMTIFAGISGWTYRRFALWTGVFVLLWAYTFVWLGNALGRRWEDVARVITRFGVALVALVVALVAVYLITVIRQNKRAAAATTSPSAPLPAVGATKPPAAPTTTQRRSSKTSKKEQTRANSRSRR